MSLELNEIFNMPRKNNSELNNTIKSAFISLDKI